MLLEYSVTKMIYQLEECNLLPAILFRTSRKQCDSDIERLSDNRGLILPRDQQEAIRQEIDRLVDFYNVEHEVIVKHDQYEGLVKTGVGAHHAGQLLIWRLILEELMSRGLLRMMIATGTVAAGVDFPARSVVITAHSKRGNEGFNTLSSSEFQQMSGRAGRRGKDKVGFCFVAPGPFSDARILSEVAKRPPEPLRSAYFASPSTVLNLLKYRSVDDLRYTVEKSLASFLDRKEAAKMRYESEKEEATITANKEAHADVVRRTLKKARRHQREAAAIESRQIENLDRTLAGLSALGYVENGKLSEKGLWAAHLCTSLVLELGEAVNEFLFTDLSLEELVGLVASIAGDSHRVYLSIKQNPIKGEYYDKLKEIVNRVRASYQNPQTSELEVVSNASVTVLSWLEAESWAEYAGLLRLGGVSDGDAGRLIMQTADHLGQLARLYETHPELARVAAEGRRKLLKPPLSESSLVE